MRTALACFLAAGLFSTAASTLAGADAAIAAGTNERPTGENAAPAPAQRTGFTNARVSTRTPALNVPVNVDFVTLPRQVDGVDIATVVNNALVLLSAGEQWRVLSPAKVEEHPKTKTVQVSFALLPRKPGQFPLPQIPLAWLNGNQIADLGLVNVADKIQVATELKDMPKEATEVAGFAWGMPLADAKPRLGAVTQDGETTIGSPATGLRLLFRGGVLGAATLDVADLDLPKARESFLSRWGVPQTDERDDAGVSKRLTWVIGWTRIEAEPAAAGVRLTLTREDIAARLARAQVNQRVFDVLDSGPQLTPEQKDAVEKHDAEQRKTDIEKEFGKPAIPAPK